MKIYTRNLLKKRLDILLVLLAVLPALAVGWLAHNFMFNYLRSDLIEDVGLVAQNKHNQLTAVLAREKDRAELFLSDLANLCGGYSTRLNQVCVSNLLGSYLTAEGARGATLFRRGGIVVTVGGSTIQSEDDLKLKSGQLAKFSGAGPEGNRSYFVAASEKASGLELGITYPTSNIQPIFAHAAGLAEPGETFLVDGAGYFATPAKSATTHGYSQPISAQAVQSCLHGSDGEEIGPDYSGAEAIYGLRAVPEFGMACISANADRKEAFAPLVSLEKKALIVFLVLLVPVIWMALRVARKIGTTEASLRTSESKFRLLFESATDSLVVLDLTGNIRDINQTGYTRLGYEKAEMVGKNISEFDAPEFAALVPTRSSEIAARGQAIFESAHVRRDGVLMFVEINAKVVELDGERRIFSVIRDITERKQMENRLREREAQYRAVIETSANGFWMVDMQGRMLEVNDAYVRLSGYSREELLSMHISDVEAAEESEDTATHIAKVMTDGHDRFESRHRTKDGRIWPVEVVTSYWPIDGGRFFVFLADITRRNLLEQFTRENERRTRALFSHLLDGFALLKVISTGGQIEDFVCVEVNEAFKSLTGLDDVIGKSGRTIFPGIRENNPEIFQGLCGVARGGKPERFETHLKALQKWYALSVYSPEEGYVVIMFDDISQRKYFEQMVSTRLDYLTRQANDIIFLTDRRGNLIDVNDRAIEAYGYSAEEFSGINIAALRAPEWTPPFEQRQEEIEKTGALRFESVHRRKDGSILPVEVSARVIEVGGELFVQTIARDISERKSAEHLLLEKERRLAEAQHLAKLGSWEWDAATGVIHWSEELYRIFGYATDQPLPPYEEYLQLYAPRSRMLFEVAVEQARYAGQVTECDLELNVQGGAERWVFARFEPTRDSEGCVTGIRGTVQDITERKHQEEAMQAANREISDLYNNAPCGYHSLDENGLIVAINNTELTWLGYRRNEIVGKKRLPDLLAPDSIPVFKETFPKLKEKGLSRDVELELVRKDGRLLPVLISATAIKDQGGKFVMSRSTVYDMTDKKKMDEERAQYVRRLQKLSQRMVAAQELERRWLASELHDRSGANLAAVSLNCKNILAKLTPDLREDVGAVLEDTQALVADTTANIREICSNLRPDVLDRASFWRALEGYAKQFSRRTGIALHLEEGGEDQHFPPNIKSTLFRIAQEALTNSAKHSQATEIRIGLSKGRRENTVLTISDNGRGFDKDEFAHPGHAPGLGLITMQERAEFIGGKFSYETGPGKGMHIRVELVDNRKDVLADGAVNR